MTGSTENSAESSPNIEGGREHRLRSLVPIGVVCALSAPTFALPFLWDDFDFLGRGLHLKLVDLLPSPESLFYRPISRELYFGLINALGGTPLVGHMLNLIVLAAIVFLFTTVASRLCGARAGHLAGLLFASFGALPILVGWASGSQDLLAMALILAACKLELDGKGTGALAAFAGALLSKETSLVLAPALVFAHAIRKRAKPDPRRWLAYGTVIVVWAAIHPGIRHLFAGGMREGSGGYLAAPSTPGLINVGNGFLALANAPLGPGTAGELRLLAAPVAVALGFIWAAHRWGSRLLPQPRPPGDASRSQIVLFASLFALPPLLVTSLFLEHWSHYHTCIAALGVATLGGMVLTSMRLAVAWLVVGAYLCLGAWSRTSAVRPTVTTEKNLRFTGQALSTVEKGFKRLRPDFPPGSNIYVSAQVSGPSGVYHHLYRYQPHRVWYHQPRLFVLDPNRFRPGAKSEYLFWIDEDHNVFEIDPRSLIARGSGRTPDTFGYQKTLRTFALGRAASGDVYDAVRILVTMRGRPDHVAVYDRPTAAGLLIASGRIAEAHGLLAGVPSFGREEALDAILAVLAEPVPGLFMDDGVMLAFGIDPRDVEANRFLMRSYAGLDYREAALRFARRVVSFRHGDEEAEAIIGRLSQSSTGPQVTVPIPHD